MKRKRVHEVKFILIYSKWVWKFTDVVNLENRFFFYPIAGLKCVRLEKLHVSEDKIDEALGQTLK